MKSKESDNHLLFLRDCISGLGAFASIFVLAYATIGDIFLSIEISTIVLLAIFLLVHEGTNNPWVGRRVMKYLNIGNEDESGVVRFYTESDDANSEKFSEDDHAESIEGIEKSVPTSALLFATTVSILILFFDLSNSGVVSNQIYGLIFDGSGGIILVYERFRGIPGTLSIFPGGQARKMAEGVWGFLFLGIGFSLQILSLIPFKFL